MLLTYSHDMDLVIRYGRFSFNCGQILEMDLILYPVSNVHKLPSSFLLIQRKLIKHISSENKITTKIYYWYYINMKKEAINMIVPFSCKSHSGA